MNLYQNEYDKIKNAIYSYTGISIRDNESDSLSRKVNSRMEKLGLNTVRDYYQYLISAKNREEIEELVSLIVNPETYFFRDYNQFKVFAEQVLPLVAKRNSDNKSLSILSAGCSTGDEPYTLAIILKEMMDNIDEWNIRIDAVDISQKVLQKAREGNYHNRAIRETPYIYRDKYFTQNDNTYSLNNDIKEMVTFRHLNIFDRVQMLALFPYDVVFCRNVLIYFDQAASRKVMEYFNIIMNPEAFIFLGPAESINRLPNLFKVVRFSNLFVYQK